MPTKQKFSSQLHTNMTAATYKHTCKENTMDTLWIYTVCQGCYAVQKCDIQHPNV